MVTVKLSERLTNGVEIIIIISANGKSWISIVKTIAKTLSKKD